MIRTWEPVGQWPVPGAAAGAVQCCALSMVSNASSCTAPSLVDAAMCGSVSPGQALIRLGTGCRCAIASKHAMHSIGAAC
jgi:hypothetical protein